MPLDVEGRHDARFLVNSFVFCVSVFVTFCVLHHDVACVVSVCSRNNEMHNVQRLVKKLEICREINSLRVLFTRSGGREEGMFWRWHSVRFPSAFLRWFAV